MNSYAKERLLNDGHWICEDHTQRIAAKDWRQLLLNGDDQVIMHGRLRKLIGKNLGFGVVEISKEPLKE